MALCAEFYHHETYKPRREQIFTLVTSCQHCLLFEELENVYVCPFFFMMAVEIGFNFLGACLFCYVWDVGDIYVFFLCHWHYFSHRKTCFIKSLSSLFFMCVLFCVLFLRHLQVLRQNLILRSYCFGSYHTELFLN